MERQIAQVNYWLGLISSVLAIVWKALESVHVLPETLGSFKYMTLYKGGLLFLVIAVASCACAWAKNQKT